MLIGIGIALILFIIFIISYLLNKKVPKPDGCDEVDEHCLDCSNPLCRNKKIDKKENEKNV